MDVELTQSGTTWSATLSLACEQSHNYYCRAKDAAANQTDDFLVAFALDVAPDVGEAESGTLVSPVVAVEDAAAGNGYYIKTTTLNQGTATYTATISTTGYYNLVGRFFVTDTGTDSWYFTIDSGEEKTWNLAGFYGEWANKTYPDSFLLTAGNHTLQFRGREADTYFDFWKFDLIACNADQLQYCATSAACIAAGGEWADGVGLCTTPFTSVSSGSLRKLDSGAGGGTYNSTGRTMRP
jgi:hypothetical protein